MGSPLTPDEILEQIRRMPLEDREYIQAELLRDGYESGRYVDPPEVLAEVMRRAKEAIENPGPGFTLEESRRRVHAVLEAVRKRGA